jgi:heat-inducible transcriptional repressor
MLDDRKSAILGAIVRLYVETGQPVGSTGVAADLAVKVSPATVRNEMTTLEREGYLVQPHTSAGRIPTEKGYRHFVDTLGSLEQPDPDQARTVKAFFTEIHGELEDRLRAASQLLSRLTATAAVVVGDSDDSAQVRSVQLVPLSAATVLAVAVLSNGDVVKRSVEFHGDLDSGDDVVGAAQQALNRSLDAKALDEVTALAPTGRAEVDLLGASALAGLRAAQSVDQRVFVEGASRIASAFDAADTVREVLTILEQQVLVVRLMHDVLDRGLQVAIGSETGLEPLAECSVVVAPLVVDGTTAGTIGVLGPTRMDYRETIAAVGAVGQRLSRLLTEG